MTIESWALLLIVLPVGGWTSTGILVLSSRQVREGALTDRAVAGIILSTIATIFAALSIAFLLDVAISSDAFTAALIAIALLSNLPQFVWVVSLVAGRFR